ncbi:Protein of unknown function [Bacillus mycoides]|uniref:Uncharacterized protein n=1 Tax=Bacillus mycoides TaxID=1405 RepID=A0A1G4ELH8_BACMY|nr:Protein of unknown function [Bacillus mycoides]
MSYLEANDF